MRLARQSVLYGTMPRGSHLRFSILMLAVATCVPSAPRGSHTQSAAPDAETDASANFMANANGVHITPLGEASGDGSTVAAGTDAVLDRRGEVSSGAEANAAQGPNAEGVADGVTLDPSAAPNLARSACATRDPQAPSARSPNGKTIVFVSKDPRRQDMTAVGTDAHEDICIKREGTPPRPLLAGHEVEAIAEGRVTGLLTAFDHFLFSADGATLYFESTQWVNENAAFSSDLATGKEHFVNAGTVIAVVQAGTYRGDVVSRVREHEEDAGNKTTKFFVVTPSGTRVRRLRAGCTDRRQCGADSVCVKAKGAIAGACIPIR
jgi:hypothetical protein